MKEKRSGLAGRFLPLAIPPALVLALALVVWAAPGGSSGGRALAVHDSVPCNEVPAGWSCVPLVNKPSSGPGITSPAIGELQFKFVDADTLWLSVSALAGQGTVQAGAQFCLDDDNEPYSDPTAGGGNKPHDCTGAGAGAVQVTDGTSGIPDASPAEPDNDSAAGLDGQYEVRITGIATDGTADGLTFAEFNNIDGYLFFVYHVNIGDASTQAFFQAPPTPTPTPPPPPGATPTPTPPPPPGATPTPTPPPALGEVRAPVALPATGGGSASGGAGAALLWLGALGLAAFLGGGLWFAYRTVRIK